MYQAYFIDLDGTMYRGKERIPSAEQFVKKLQKKGIPFLFVTNNATKTPEQVAGNLCRNFGVLVGPETVYTSGMAAVDYITHETDAQRIMLIGESALQQQLEEQGLEIVNDHPDLVLQSLNRQVTYQDLKQATLAIRSGADFVVTNIDSNLPSEEGLIPGSGSLTAFLKASTQVEPIVMGKPNSIIMDLALAYLNQQYPERHFSKEHVAMVGDNYTTDILAGIDYGMDTIMVLTGFSTREDLKKVDQQPTHLVTDLSEWLL